jgi:hypothetical protein
MPQSPIIPDTGVVSFLAGEVKYHYFVNSHMFLGGCIGVRSSTGNFNGGASITACIDSYGNISSGAIQVSGGFPSSEIPKGSLLLLGSVLSVVIGAEPPVGSPASACFIFKINFTHPSLLYYSPLGVWYASFNLPPGVTISNLFKTSWGPASEPLNTYIGQIKCLF